MANKSFKDIVGNRQQILEENNNKSTVPKAEPVISALDSIEDTPKENTQTKVTLTAEQPKKERNTHITRIERPKREISITTRVTKDEYEDLYSMAIEYGCKSVSDYVYYLITKKNK